MTDLPSDKPVGEPGNSPEQPGVTRRGFLAKGAAAVTGRRRWRPPSCRCRHLNRDDLPSIEEFLQKHYKEMTPKDKERIFARIRREVARRYKVDPVLADPRPLTGVEFVYGLNLSRCIGCRRCVHACVKENNQSRAPEIQYIRVLEMEKGREHRRRDVGSSLRSAAGAEVGQVLHAGAMPPVREAAVREGLPGRGDVAGSRRHHGDRLRLVHRGAGIARRACPYWARRFNFADPQVPADQINPNMSYLSNRPRRRGVMEKCTFCLHRTRVGRMPACLEVCPTGSRKFGNVLDPESEVAYILKHKRVFILKQDVGTLPRFFYFFDERGSRYREPIDTQPAGGKRGGRMRKYPHLPVGLLPAELRRRLAVSPLDDAADGGEPVRCLRLLSAVRPWPGRDGYDRTRFPGGCTSPTSRISWGWPRPRRCWSFRFTSTGTCIFTMW